MTVYQANGARVSRLLVPEQPSVEILGSEASGESLRLEVASILKGRRRFDGLSLEFAEIREGDR